MPPRSSVGDLIRASPWRSEAEIGNLAHGLPQRLYLV